ncbi:MAG: hypothetical protein ABFS34_16180 [Gemmatimonadota bacterium]
MTRRVRDRRFRMAPSREVNNAMGYLTAVLVQKYGIEFHALTFLSDHKHDVNHDPNGRLPDFNRDLHHFITKQLNAMFGDEGPMWDSKQTSHVRPVEPDDILGRIGYTAANAVHHELVKFAKDWPGLSMCWPCPPRTFKRPKRGFMNFDAKHPDGSDVWPEVVTLTMHRPPGFDDLSDNELAIRIKDAIEAVEQAAHDKVEKKRGRFVGRRAILRTKREACATSVESKSDINPRIACKNKKRREEAIEEDRAWMRKYRPAFKAWQAGDRDVEFPHGTYKMLVVHRANVAGPD